MGKTHSSGLFLQILSILPHFNLWAFPCAFLFRKEPLKYLGIYESTPQPQGMNTVKWKSRDLRFPRLEISQEKFGEWRLFPPSKFLLAASKRFNNFPPTLSALQGFSLNSDRFNQKPMSNIAKSYIRNMPRAFPSSNCFLINLCLERCNFT